MAEMRTTAAETGNETVIEEARRLGAALVGFAPVSRWAEYGEVAEDYRPESIWPAARTVIVLGIPLMLPIVESTPSINYQELYNTTNGLLDQLAYRLASFLNGLGHASIPLPRDGYGNLEVLLKKMPASFSHVYAGKYAGLGTIGFSHNLINPEYGPRVRYVSVFTRGEFAATPVLTRDLCNACDLCAKLCPANALTRRERDPLARFDAIACTRHHQQLVRESRWPCGVCIKVCPIGEDRLLYAGASAGNYVTERKAITANPRDKRFRHLVHLRSHGSLGETIA
jgi:epoxyqueuosine reductase QueG